jgi:hypothetical protein
MGVQMHIKITFITKATDIDDATSKVDGYLETENFYDYCNTLNDEVGTLDKKRVALLELQETHDSKKKADEFYATAEELKAKGNLNTAGYYYRKAGALFEELLTDDVVVYNIDSYNYEIPENDDGLVNGERWFAVPVDFHV